MSKAALRLDQKYDSEYDVSRTVRYDRAYDADKDKATESVYDSSYFKGNMPYGVSMDTIFPGNIAPRGMFPGFSQWLGSKQRHPYYGDRQYSPLDLAGTNTNIPKVKDVLMPRTPSRINVVI